MNAVTVESLSKVYQLYDKPIQRLKEAFSIIRKKYHRDFNALNPLSFSIEKGQCYGIIGVNGSGKSTLLKMITGVLSPTTGTISVDGKVSALLELGAGFNMDYTGIENIFLNGTIMGYSREEMQQKIKKIADFADIGEFINQPVKTYSSGMFARLAFAVAINVDPDILIVDEALSVGDIYFQAKCYQKFEEFKAAGKTIIFVTHDMGSVLKYCDTVMVLNKGDLVKIGTAAEMVDIYKKILSNQLNDENEDVISDKSDESNWSNSLAKNPNPEIYGTKEAIIKDFAIMDAHGKITNTIVKNTEYTIMIKVQFNTKIIDPIVAFTIINPKGLELTGTNTLLENKVIGEVKKGDVITVSFSQTMVLQAGEYLLNLGVTKYGANSLDVFFRYYNCCSIDVIGVKNTVGIFDSNSSAKIER